MHNEDIPQPKYHDGSACFIHDSKIGSPIKVCLGIVLDYGDTGTNFQQRA